MADAIGPADNDWGAMLSRWQAMHAPGAADARPSPWDAAWQGDSRHPLAGHAAGVRRDHNVHGPNLFGTVQAAATDGMADPTTAANTVDDVHDAWDEAEPQHHMAANPQLPGYAAPGIGIGAQWAASSAMDGFKSDNGGQVRDPAQTEFMSMPLLEAVMNGTYVPAPEAIEKAGAGGQSFAHGIMQHTAGMCHEEMKPHSTSGHEMLEQQGSYGTSARSNNGRPAPAIDVNHLDLRGSCQPTVGHITDAHQATRLAQQPDMSAPTGSSMGHRGTGFARPNMSGPSMQTVAPGPGNHFAGLTRRAPGER